MANRDAAFGFIPIDPNAPCHEYTATTSTTIFRGDPVIAVTAGTVTVGAASSGVINVGIAAEYVASAAAGAKIMVYDDPNTEFIVQVLTGSTLTIADVFGTADIDTYTSGNTTTGQSKVELADPAGSTAPWLICRLYDTPDNAWGENCRVVVRPNQSVHKDAYAGLT
jgi:hypothetical protein